MILKRNTAEYLKRRWSKSRRICSFGRIILKRKDGTGDLQMYLAIGVCKPERGCVADLQKALKVLGYNTRIRENDGEPFLLPQRERQKQTPPRQKQERER